MPTFKEVNKIREETQVSIPLPDTSSTASKMLAPHLTKDKRFTIRLSTITYDQFQQINKKLGATSNSVINMLIAKYINDNKDLLI